jgi:hypothetical protein
MCTTRGHTAAATTAIAVRFDKGGAPRLELTGSPTVSNESQKKLLNLLTDEYERLSRGRTEFMIPAWISELAGKWISEPRHLANDRYPELRLTREQSGMGPAGSQTPSALPEWVPEYLRWAEQLAASQPDEVAAVLAGEIRSLRSVAEKRPSEFLRQILIGHLQSRGIEDSGSSKELQIALRTVAIESLRAMKPEQLHVKILR